MKAHFIQKKQNWYFLSNWITPLLLCSLFSSCIDSQVRLSIDFRACISQDGECRSRILEQVKDLPLAGCLMLKTNQTLKFGFKFENEAFRWIKDPYLSTDELNHAEIQAKMVFFSQSQSLAIGSCDASIVDFDMSCGDDQSCIFSLEQERVSLQSNEININFKGDQSSCHFTGLNRIVTECQKEQILPLDMMIIVDQRIKDSDTPHHDQRIDFSEKLDQHFDMNPNDQILDFACMMDRNDDCNGLDDDCDGKIDEGAIEPILTTCGEGICQKQIYQNCINGRLQGEACEPNLDLRVEEICNEKDDDCDGVIDNGFDLENDVNHCGRCDQGCQILGSQQIFSCQNRSCVFTGCLENYYSTPNTQDCAYYCEAHPEECDGLDNDCDFKIDESLVPRQSAQYNYSICMGIEQRCEAGVWREPNEAELSLIAGYGQEVCDGIDNDCDGTIDDAVFGLNLACTDSSKLGLCQNGTQRCINAQLSCVTNGPSADFCNGIDESCDGIDGIPEQCNGVDDNCDGIIDNYPICAPCSAGGTTPAACPGVGTGEWITVEAGQYGFQQINRFQMFKTEVTVQMYRSCVNAGQCDREPLDTCGFFQRDDLNPYPMACVNFNHINQYLAWSGTSLPNDLEWKFVAGNRNGTWFPWGNDSNNFQLANVGTGNPSIPCSYPQGNSINGQICDLIGNVWEWVLNISQNVNGAYIRKGASYHIDNSIYAGRAINEFYDLEASNNRGFRMILRSGF
jgi:hypothetical protein